MAQAINANPSPLPPVSRPRFILAECLPSIGHCVEDAVSVVRAAPSSPLAASFLRDPVASGEEVVASNGFPPTPSFSPLRRINDRKHPALGPCMVAICAHVVFSAVVALLERKRCARPALVAGCRTSSLARRRGYF